MDSAVKTKSNCRQPRFSDNTSLALWKSPSMKCALARDAECSRPGPSLFFRTFAYVAVSITPLFRSCRCYGHHAASRGDSSRNLCNRWLRLRWMRQIYTSTALCTHMEKHFSACQHAQDPRQSMPTTELQNTCALQT